MSDPDPRGLSRGLGATATKVLAAGLLLLLAGIVAYQVAQSAGPAPAPPAARVPAAVPGEPAATGGVPDVRLEALGRERPGPVAAGRNPFRFEAASPPSGAARPAASIPAPHDQAGPGAPGVGIPGPSPIPLKFIGIVEAPRSAGRLAVLSDGRFVYHGREGEVVDGRYRIVRIGLESIVIEHVDGRGRQTIRLTG